ncbi:hypothetical protein BC936DRAFT_142699, partial [Jimgerdemannia flammicorona]
MHTPVLLILYGHPQDTERVGSVLAEGLKYLKEPPFFNPECRYQNPHIAISSIPRSMRYLPFDASYPGSRGQSQTHRDISLLLDSIPSEVDATGVGGSDDLPIGEGKIDGLNIELMRHQIQGVAWMRDREVNQNLVAEGVRTIQTLALIVTDRATAEKPHRRTTLIVCPLALIRQWESELMGKAGQNIIKLLKYDVVITTYQVVASEYPESKTRGRGKKKRQDEVSAGAEPNGRGRKGRGGPQPVQLHSGNGVHQSMVIEFREQISKPMQSGQSDIALGRLKALLRAMMLRRTKHILKQNHTRMMMESRNSGASSSSAAATSNGNTDDQPMTDSQGWCANARSSSTSSAVEDADTDEGGDSGGEKVEGRPAQASAVKSEEMAFLNLPGRNIEVESEDEDYDEQGEFAGV